MKLQHLLHTGIVSMAFAIATLATLWPEAPTQRYIVQSHSAAHSAEVVAATGAEVSHQLSLINSVDVRLSDAQAATLRQQGLKLFATSPIKASALSSVDLGG